MSEITDKPGIQEQYGKAIRSSQLQVNSLRITDVDSLIAAGWLMGGAAERRRQRAGGAAERNRVEHELAPLLLRLHVEFDTVKGEQALALKRQIVLDEAIKESAKDVARLLLAKTADDELLKQKVADLEALRKQAQSEALSNHLMMLSKVRTLEPARDALCRWATIEASKFPLQGVRLPAEPRRRADETEEQLQARHAEWHRRVVRAAMERSLSDKAVAAITGRVLRSWLNPRCASCSGVGSVLATQPRAGKRAEKGAPAAGYGSSLQTKCSVCRGTGLIRESLGDTDTERRFARHMLDRMSEMLAMIERELRRFLHAQAA